MDHNSAYAIIMTFSGIKSVGFDECILNIPDDHLDPVSMKLKNTSRITSLKTIGSVSLGRCGGLNLGSPVSLEMSN